MKIINIFLVVLILFCTFFFLSNKTFDDRVYIISRFDNKKYLVRNTIDKHNTADALARLISKIESLIEYLNNNIQNYQEYSGMIKRLKSRFKANNISEGVIDHRYTSYTINKGQEVTLCMKSRDHLDSIYDDDILYYVMAHELAHIGSITVDHNDEFKKNFSFILNVSLEKKLFKMKQESFNYCGLQTEM